MLPENPPRLAPLFAAALWIGALCALPALSAGCGRPASAQLEHGAEQPLVAPPAPLAPAPPSAAAVAPASLPPAPPSAAPAPALPARTHITLLAGGDVSFGRRLGQVLLRDPAHDPFASVSALLASADLRFVNLESQLSDQKGETESRTEKLVFTGPPGGAAALARARISVVSTANNHMWDYGRSAFLETLENLERAGVPYAGAGRTREAAYAPTAVEHEGFRLAVLAVTDIWNQGPLAKHPGREHVAAADAEGLAAAVRAAKADPAFHAIVVSYHGGSEHIDMPLVRTRAIAHAAIDAGADAFLGHHPHVIQGVEIRAGKPIFYSLGNFLMGMNQSHPETGIGMLARVVLRRGALPSFEVCPFRMVGLAPLPLSGDPERSMREVLFLQRFQRVSSFLAGAAAIGPLGEDGCAPLRAREATEG